MNVVLTFMNMGTLTAACKWTVFWLTVIILPPILLGIIRKTKAYFQGRIGAGVQQPLLDLIKMLHKGETLSSVTSWVFRSTSAINFSVILLIAVLTPWISFKPTVFEQVRTTLPALGGPISATEQGARPDPDSTPNGISSGTVSPPENALTVQSISINGMSVYSSQPTSQPETTVPREESTLFGHATTGSDVFLIIYMFALARLFTVLAALDSGSAFGGFGASREVTLALLVEPAIVLAFVSLGCAAHTSDLNSIFFWKDQDPIINLPSLWFIAGVSLFLANVVELSRMPVDDPTNHLELSMVHEAMILENSGRNLALVEYAHMLKMTVLLGLTSQCFLHGLTCFMKLTEWMRDILSIVFIITLAIVIAVIESLTVKLSWTKTPEFIAYSVAMSLLCTFIAIGVGH